MVAGMVTTAAMTSTADQRALGERKLRAASIQQATSMAKRVAMYQRKAVQSMERWVRRAELARKGRKDRQTLVGEKELGGERVETGIEQLSGCGDVDIGVFNAEVIAVDGDSGGGEKPETDKGQARGRGFLSQLIFLGGDQ